MSTLYVMSCHVAGAAAEPAARARQEPADEDESFVDAHEELVSPRPFLLITSMGCRGQLPKRYMLPLQPALSWPLAAAGLAPEPQRPAQPSGEEHRGRVCLPQ